jgi:hypothetical protein
VKDDYRRLLAAARDLKGWDGASAIATHLSLAGYKVSEQTMTNWKSRGLSFEAYLRTSQIIGCRPNWLETGGGPMKDAPDTSTVAVSHAAQRLIDRLIALDAAGNWTPALQRALDALLDLAAPRDAARGPEALSGLIASMAADPGSQTPESITALKQAMGQVAKKRTATKDEDHAQGRGKAKGGRH